MTQGQSSKNVFCCLTQVEFNKSVYARVYQACPRMRRIFVADLPGDVLGGCTPAARTLLQVYTVNGNNGRNLATASFAAIHSTTRLHSWGHFSTSIPATLAVLVFVRQIIMSGALKCNGIMRNEHGSALGVRTVFDEARHQKPRLWSTSRLVLGVDVDANC